MKNLLILMILCSIFGCTEISFKEAQPKGKKALAQIPEDLRGRYILESNDDSPSRDTIIVESNGFRIGYFNPEEREKNKNEGLYYNGLGDSLVLKKYKQYYFLNFNESPEWILRMIKRESNGDLTYMTLEQPGLEFKNYMKKLGAVIDIDSVKVNNEMLYQINPSGAELIRLMKKGYMSKTTLRKVN